MAEKPDEEIRANKPDRTPHPLPSPSAASSGISVTGVSKIPPNFEHSGNPYVNKDLGWEVAATVPEPRCDYANMSNCMQSNFSSSIDNYQSNLPFPTGTSFEYRPLVRKPTSLDLNKFDIPSTSSFEPSFSPTKDSDMLLEKADKLNKNDAEIKNVLLQLTAKVDTLSEIFNYDHPKPVNRSLPPLKEEDELIYEELDPLPIENNF